MKAPSLRIVFTLTLLVFLALPTGRADEDDDETPASSVARLSLVRGDVSLQRGDSGDWVSTVVNTPLIIGDTLATDDDSRAEAELDDAHVLRLDGNTQVKIANLTPSNIQLMVAQGRVDFVTLRRSAADVESDTPNVSVHPVAEGVYRIQVNSDLETQLTVRRGEAEVSTAEGSVTVGMDQLIAVRGTDDPAYQSVDAPARDAWDDWNEARDHDILEAQSWRYANPYYTGASDLDSYGQWVQVPGYDWCWTPYVKLGWVPYGYGRWVWEPYWGWTWVSYEPWGWAPYHYGRWFFWGNSWVWWPGPSQPTFRPVWAPAYVSFLGFGFGGRSWSFGAGFGYQTIGWLPVGPSDPYYPWSGHPITYNAVKVTNITNITNVTNVNNIRLGKPIAPLSAAGQPVMSNLQSAMNNVRVRQAIVTASTQDFEKGAVPRNPQPVDPATLRQAQLVQGTLPAVPTRESLRPVDRPANPTSTTARLTNNQHFFTKNEPPAGPRPFIERATEIRQMVQQTNPAEPGAPRSSASSGREVGQNQGAASSGQATAAEAERTPAAPEEKTGRRHFGPTTTTQAPSSRSTTKQAGSAGQELRATPSAKTAGREENLSPGGAKPPAELIHKKEVQSPEKEEATTEPTKPEHAAEEPTRPGWHRFGDEGSKSDHPKSQPRPEKSKAADSESDKKDQSKKTQH